MTTYKPTPGPHFEDDVEREQGTLRDDPKAGNGRESAGDEGLPLQLHFADFLAYAPMGNFIFRATGQLWPGKSIDARLSPVYVRTDEDGEKVFIKASTWIQQYQPVEQMTWQPGEPEIIRNRLVVEGAWEDHPGARVYNHYRPPTLVHGDSAKAAPFVSSVRRSTRMTQITSSTGSLIVCSTPASR